MEAYHESREKLDEKTLNITRAITSLIEELEAIDWYNQRVQASENEELRDIMAHNRDEEIEHACMLLEWLRRNMDKWDEELGTYLFSEGPLGHTEAVSKNGEKKEASLNIGNLK